MERPRKRIRIAEPEDDDLILKTSRHANDMRLKSTFESIFAKYAQDFTEVGDEIDMVTGKIVVDNGHVAGMRDEQDVGRGDAQRFLRALTSTDNDATGNILESHSGAVEDHHREAGRLDSRNQGSTPTAIASRSLAAGQPQQSPLDSAMLQELSKNIASILLPHFTGLGRTSQATEPAWRTPDIGFAWPTGLPQPGVSTPAIRCRRTSPKTESLWAVPERRASASHARAIAGQLEWHGRILDDDSETDELSPAGSVVHNGSGNLKHAREKKRSFPPFSREEDQRLIKMREGPEFDNSVHWKDICRQFPGRPLWSLMYRYNKHLKSRAVDSATVPAEMSSPIRSHADGVAPGTMLPSPISIEPQGGVGRTMSSHTSTWPTAAYINRDEDEQPPTVVANEALPQPTELSVRRLLRNKKGRFRRSSSFLDSVPDKAHIREGNGGPKGTPAVFPSGDSLDAEAVKLSQVHGSPSSGAVRETPDDKPESAGITRRSHRAARRVKERKQAQTSSQATPSRSSTSCQVVIPRHHQQTIPVAEPSLETSRPERSTPSKANKPLIHSGGPATPITPTREHKSPSSTRQHAIRFNKRKQSSVYSGPAATPNSSRRTKSKLNLSPESEDELAL